MGTPPSTCEAISPLQPAGNGARLYVLAGGRLVVMWSVDSLPRRVLVSPGRDRATLKRVDAPEVTWDADSPPGQDFRVNRAGVALSSSIVNPCDVEGVFCPAESDEGMNLHWDIEIHFSSDLTKWRTVGDLQA